MMASLRVYPGKDFRSSLDRVLEKHNFQVATDVTSVSSERIGTTGYPHIQFKQLISLNENTSKDDKFPRMVADYASEPFNEAVNLTNTDNVMDDFLDEARYNLATRVMSNGVEVIIASDKSRTTLPGADVASELATKDSPQEQQNLKLRVVPSQAVYRPMTLAASTLKNQMILVMPSQNTEPVNFSTPVDLNQFVTKICLTTYTYRTTYLQDGATTVESQEQVISNIATEERNYFRMTPALSLGVTLTRTPALAIGIFPTTYSYYNTIQDADTRLVQKSKRTIINTITGPDDYIHFLQPSEDATPSHETNTYYSKLTFTNTLHDDGVQKFITATNMLTQVIVTESMPPRSATLLPTKVEYFDDQRAPNVKKASPILAANIKAETSEEATAHPLRTENDIHIYTTKTFATTFMYYKTLLLGQSGSEEFSTPSKKFEINGSGGQTPIAVSNYHTRIIENVITETLHDSWINSEMVSKFRNELKKGKNERRVIITTLSLLGGQTLKITAMHVLTPALKTATTQNQTVVEPTNPVIRPTSHKITKFTKLNHNNNASAPTVKRTKATATIIAYTTKWPKVSATSKHPSATKNTNGQLDGVLVDETSFDETGGNNDYELNDTDSLPADSHYDAVYVSKLPTVKKPSRPQTHQKIENSNANNNQNRLPVAVNHIIGSLNLQHLTALRPVFNAMAGLLQSNFASTLNQKNMSSVHKQQQQLQQMATLTVPVPVYSVPLNTDSGIVLKLENSADTETKHHIEASTAKKFEQPIYIPVKDTSFAVDSHRPQSETAAFDYAAELLDTNGPQSLHIQPPQTDVLLTDDEDSWLLQRIANDLYSQQFASQQVSPQSQPLDYKSQSQTHPKSSNQDQQSESQAAGLISDKKGFETSLINGGIPIRPGEVISANSDVIIGKPNGIQYPLIHVPKTNALVSTNLTPTRHGTPPGKAIEPQKAPQSYRGNSPVSNHISAIPLLDMQQLPYTLTDYQNQQQLQQQSSTFPHMHTTLHVQTKLRQQYQQDKNRYAQIMHWPKENYDNILKPPPMGSLQSSTSPVTPLSPPPLMPSTTTNSYTAYAQTLGLRTPPSLPTSPFLSLSRVQSIQKQARQNQSQAQYTHATPPSYTDTSQLNSFTYEPHRNEITTATNLTETSALGEKMITFKKAPNLYDIMLNTFPQSVDYYEKHSKTPQQASVGYVPPEFSSYSYAALNATYDTMDGEDPPLQERKPVGSPSNHQHINLNTHVFSHNVNMNAPPLTFKREPDYPTHASAVHGQIPSNIASTGQRLPFTIANMPHVNIPHNKKQIQVNLTPQNVIGQIIKPKANTKRPAGTSMEAPPTAYSNENSAASAVIGSFSVDNSLQGFLNTQLHLSPTHVNSPKLTQNSKPSHNYAQMYVMSHSDSASIREVNTLQRVLKPASSAIAATLTQNALENEKTTALSQPTHGLSLTPPTVTLVGNDNLPPYEVHPQSNTYHSIGSKFTAPAADLANEHDKENGNAVAGDFSTSTIYYDHDNTINEVENSLNLDENEDAVEEDNYGSGKRNDSFADVRAEQSTATATKSLHEQMKTKQQQLITLHSTPPKKFQLQEWQQKINQEQVLQPFLSPNAALKLNDLHGAYDKLRGVSFTSDKFPVPHLNVKAQTPTQPVHVAKGEGFKRPEIREDEILVQTEKTFSHSSATTRPPYILNDQKHTNTRTTAAVKLEISNYNKNEPISRTTFAPMTVKFGTSSLKPPTSSPQASIQRLQLFSSSATPPPVTAATSNSKDGENTPTTTMTTRKTQPVKQTKPFNDVYTSYANNFESTPADLEYIVQANAQPKPTNRLHQLIAYSTDMRLPQPAATNMEGSITNSNISSFGYKQLHAQSIVGLNPPPPPKPKLQPILLAPMKIEPSYVSASGNNSKHIYNTINFKTMWQAPLQSPQPKSTEPTGHEISYIPRTTEHWPLKKQKLIPITKAVTLRNTTMYLGVTPKSELIPPMITKDDSRSNDEILNRPTTNAVPSSTASTEGIAPIRNIPENFSTLRSNEELAQLAITEQITHNTTIKPSAATQQILKQPQNIVKIELYEANEAMKNTVKKITKDEQVKLYPKPVLESSESTTAVESNFVNTDTFTKTIQLPSDSSHAKSETSRNPEKSFNLQKKQRQEVQQQQQTNHMSGIQNLPANTLLNGIVLLPTKYTTRTQLLTVTTTRSTVVLTSANEPLQSKFFMVTKTLTATILNTITHTEWATETDTETATAIATRTKTKPKIRTLVQPTMIIESETIFATTIATNIEMDSIASENNLVSDMKSMTVAEGNVSYTKIPFIDNHSYRLNEFMQPPDTADTTSSIANQIPSNNSILIVMTHSKNGGKGKPTQGIVDGSFTDVESSSDTDAGATTIELDYEDSLSVFNLPTRDEESDSVHHDLQKLPNQVLLGGVLIASPPNLLNGYGSTGTAEGSAASVTCQPSCKLTRNEVCALRDRHWRCACRPGFARMFPDRPCKPTYTYAMRLLIDCIGNYELLYHRTLGDNSTDEYKQLAGITKEAVDRMVMQSDFRDIYHGVQLTTFMPLEATSLANDDAKQQKLGVSANFLLQLSENSDEKRLVSVFKKYLRLSNYSIGGTELFTNRNGVKSLTIMDFDECAYIQFHDCSPNARCFNLQGTYTCSCIESFADLSGNAIYPGRMCSAELIGCDQCQYHGKCTTKTGQANALENTVCECFVWYSGARCQVNLKILLIALIAIGTLLFTLLMFCIILVCTKRHSLRHRVRPLSPSSTGIHRIITAKNPALVGIGLIGGSSPRGISGGKNKCANLDKCAIIKDTSSESSKTSILCHLQDPYNELLLTYLNLDRHLKAHRLISLSYFLINTLEKSIDFNANGAHLWVKPTCERTSRNDHTTSPKKPHHRSRHPDSKIDSSIQANDQRHCSYDRLPLTEVINTNTNASGKYVIKAPNMFTDLERNYPDQSDRSLTVMIPRAKYHASVLPQTQLFHQQVLMEKSKRQQRMQQKQNQVNKSDNSTSMGTIQDNFRGILQHQKKIAKITSKELNTGGSKYLAQLSIPGVIDNDCGLTNMNLHQLGALVSAGFEVSAMVGENMLIDGQKYSRTKDKYDSLDTIVAGLNTIGDDSNSSAKACNTNDNAMRAFFQTTQPFREQQQLIEQTKLVKHFLNRDLEKSENSTLPYFAGDIHNSGNNARYECGNESTEAHSIDETTTQAVMKPLHICFDTQTTNTNDEANTMEERDVGSTFLLPHTHLYKPDLQGSDISGFDSF